MIHKKIKLKKRDDIQAIQLPTTEKEFYDIEKYFPEQKPKTITQTKG
jgi:hypothetical protein